MKKIVIQVHDMGSDKCRSKAMKIAVVCQGVRSVAIEGESRDQLVVTGDGIDSVCLANQIRKKFRSANLVSVEDVKASIEDVKASDDGEKETEEPNTPEVPVIYCRDYYPPPYPTICVYETNPRSCFFF